MQVQRIQNNNYNPYFRAKMNIDIKLKMADITDYLKKKKISDSELQSANLNDMFIKANKNKKNDEKVAVLTGNEIYEFFEIAWKKLEETSQDIYFEMHNLVRIKRNEMWKSVERDLTPEQQVQMKNFIALQKQYSKDMAKCARKITRLSQSEKATPEQIKQAQEELDNAAKKYHDVGAEIDNLKYDKSKLDRSKYVDLEDK